VIPAVSNDARAEEQRFRDWLRTLDRQPAEVASADGDGWNTRVVAATWEYVSRPLPPVNEETDTA
jgi:hypothetical protein